MPTTTTKRRPTSAASTRAAASTSATLLGASRVEDEEEYPVDRDRSRKEKAAEAVSPPLISCFRATATAQDAQSLTDGIRLTPLLEVTAVGAHSSSKEEEDHDQEEVILPWMGFGTYRLGQEQARQATLQALQCGYRAIDTAFIYGGETTEDCVGKAIQQALSMERAEGGGGKVLPSRGHLFLTTKHWRSYHGYDQALKCLRLSLKRLQVDYIDLWLMHWPNPSTGSRFRPREEAPTDEASVAASAAQAVHLRAETWRAMEDAYRQGQVRAIGVSNFAVHHLQTLRKTASLWPPAVNQVELHPLYPQTELLEYCRSEGIVVQAYASLGGQDTGKAKWMALLGKNPIPTTNEGEEAGGGGANDDDDEEEERKNRERAKRRKKTSSTTKNLLQASEVIELARQHQRQQQQQQQKEVTPAQILLRWALDQGCPVIPKTVSPSRLRENAQALTAVPPLSMEQIQDLSGSLLRRVQNQQQQSATGGPPQNKGEDPAVKDPNDLRSLTRLCWRSDPGRLLDFA